MSTIGEAFSIIPVPPEVGDWIVNMTFNKGYWDYKKYIEDYKSGKEYMGKWDYFIYDHRPNYFNYDHFFEEINDYAESITNRYRVLIADIVAVLDEFDKSADELIYDDESGVESWASERPGSLPPSETYPAIGFLKYRIFYLLESVEDEDVEKLKRWYNWHGYFKAFITYHENKIDRIKETINEYEKYVEQLKSRPPEKMDEDTMDKLNWVAGKILFTNNYDDEPNDDEAQLDDGADYFVLDEWDFVDEEEDKEKKNE